MLINDQAALRCFLPHDTDAAQRALEKASRLGAETDKPVVDEARRRVTIYQARKRAANQAGGPPKSGIAETLTRLTPQGR
ncbi:MAG: hypothetical protein AAF556_11220 [Pseudomonadota bacterium]